LAANDYLVPRWSSSRREASVPTTCLTTARERIIFIGTPIDDTIATGLCPDAVSRVRGPGEGHQHLHQLAGGDITALSPSTTPLSTCGRTKSTFCFGQAASAAASSGRGDKGKRSPSPCADLLHHPMGRRRQASDIELQAKEILRMRDLLNEISPTTRVSRRASAKRTQTAIHHGRRRSQDTASSTRSSRAGRPSVSRRPSAQPELRGRCGQVRRWWRTSQCSSAASRRSRSKS